MFGETLNVNITVDCLNQSHKRFQDPKILKYPRVVSVLHTCERQTFRMHEHVTGCFSFVLQKSSRTVYYGDAIPTNFACAGHVLLSLFTAPAGLAIDISSGFLPFLSTDRKADHRT